MTDDEASTERDDDRPALAEQRSVDSVYGASEDSHLLAEAVVEAVEAGERALDVGTGSGYVAAALAEAGVDVAGTDLNPAACQQAREVGIPVARANLLDPIPADAVDVVAFNPPYLPADPDTDWGDWMQTALSGGEDGRAVVDPFLTDVARVLREGGRAFLLVSSLTGIEEVRDFAREQGLGSSIVAEDSFPFERLVVLRLAPD
ncbi:methyltransferase domain-containing protein [Halorhabdus sp. CBA1104]|uniref:HemK2/MTQ2 family protein methyltransferase n=1 Tax=unclassified Halorhabdus TaxID=2621901 RepID=UPI0012B1A9F2|nr:MULTISPECIES: HemK2/MTQ2 family protein methyltransferase [unclassified Halorhabdus]QGN06273.1 methyltransferase domain-containing protein [Halorhabdus sp. CBA1104]